MNNEGFSFKPLHVLWVPYSQTNPDETTMKIQKMPSGGVKLCETLARNVASIENEAIPTHLQIAVGIISIAQSVF